MPFFSRDSTPANLSGHESLQLTSPESVQCPRGTERCQASAGCPVHSHHLLPACSAVPAIVGAHCSRRCCLLPACLSSASRPWYYISSLGWCRLPCRIWAQFLTSWQPAERRPCSCRPSWPCSTSGAGCLGWRSGDTWCACRILGADAAELNRWVRSWLAGL